MNFSSLQILLLLSFAAGLLVSLLLYLLFWRPVIRRGIDRQLNKRKDQFVGLASHYLLTPISIIQAALSQLQERDSHLTQAERQKLYGSIGMGEQRLQITAEQLVLVGEVDSGNLQMHMAPGNLSNMVSEAVAAMDVFARAKNISIHFQDEITGVQEGLFDRRRMRQVMLALIDNAVKFGVEGTGVVVSARVESGIVVITVEDEGIGMPDSIMKHVSEPFYRGTDQYNFNYEGIGLGLHIATAIVAEHGGTINFVSKPKRGTLATIQFPLQ